MLIDCATCVARNVGCADCVMTVLFAQPPELDDTEQAVLGVLAQAGLVPPLRLVRPVEVRAAGRGEAYPHTA